MFRGGVPADQYAADAGAVPGGRLPGPGQVRLPQRRAGRAGAARPAGSHGLLPLPAPDGLRRPRRRGRRRCPDDVPPERAVLAGTVETAVNALWDAAPLVGDRVAVVGGGMVGLCVARLLTGIPGAEVTVVDVDPERAGGRRRHGRAASRCPQMRQPAIATSSSTRARPSAGLQLSLDLLAAGGHRRSTSAGTADTEVSLRLGGAFHSRRLSFRASQVGTVSPGAPGSPLDDRPPSARPRAAAGPGVRRPAQRQLAVRRAPRGAGGSVRRQPSGAVPHHHLRRRVGPCSA